jgi:calcineurin-like phosphoesterase family protein
MSYFFTSDTHFFHKNIIKHCSRPWDSAAEMNRELVSRWNRVVSPNDIVYHLGDVSFGSAKETVELLTQLNGRKHLVLGNHDNVVVKNANVSKMFESVNQIAELKVDGHLIVMCHYPMASWNQSHRGSIHLHGHCHGAYVPSPNLAIRRMDVGVDAPAAEHMYRPICLEKVIGLTRFQPGISEEAKLQELDPTAKPARAYPF